jgi:hypothetical protein
MVQRLIPAFGGLDRDQQVFPDFGLTDKVVQAAWPETGLQYRIFFGFGFSGYYAFDRSLLGDDSN